MLNSRRDLHSKMLVFVWLLVVAIATLFAIIFFSVTLTGRVTSSLPEVAPGKVLPGSIELDPKETGVIPYNALIAVSYGGVLKTLPVSKVFPSEYLLKYSSSGLVFTPSIRVTIEFIPLDEYNALVQGGGAVVDSAGSIPPQGEGDPNTGSPNTGGGTKNGGNLNGNVISGSDKSFFQTVTLRYGVTANLASHSGYKAVLSDVKLRDVPINAKYIQFSETSQGVVLKTTYYESLAGIPEDSPPLYVDLADFNFIAQQSSPVTISIVYLGENIFSNSIDASIANVAQHTTRVNRVFVHPNNVPTEVTVDGKVTPNTITVGPVITPDLRSAGCKSYVCDLSLGSGCSIPPLDTINEGVLVPVQKMTCTYDDCGVSFQITQPCDISSQDVSVVKVSDSDIGISNADSGSSSSEGSSGSGGGSSSVALLKQDTREPVAIITSDEGSSKIDITFLQSPPDLGNHCEDGILNSDEENIDCGGSCGICSAEKISYSIIIVWIVTLVLGLLLFLSIFNSQD